MAEWLKAHAWKACIRETVPWVRIPLPPPPTQDSPVLCDRQSVILALACQRFGEDLCTSPRPGHLFRFSDRPVFSEALYFADLVQSLPSPNLQALAKSRFRISLAHQIEVGPFSCAAYPVVQASPRSRRDRCRRGRHRLSFQADSRRIAVGCRLCPRRMYGRGRRPSRLSPS